MKRGLLIVGRLLLAGIFLYSGYAKLSEPWAAVCGVARIVPRCCRRARWSRWRERCHGWRWRLGLLWFFSGFFTRWFALIAAYILLTFESAAASAYARGLTVMRVLRVGRGSAGSESGLFRRDRDGGFGVAVTVGAFLMARKPRDMGGRAQMATEPGT